MTNKAVILGTNYYIGLSVIRCLGRKGVYTVAVDYSTKDTYGAKSKYLDEQLIGPHYGREPEKLVEFLIDFAKKQDSKPVLYPTADQYAEFIDAHLEELREHYLIWMTEPGLWTKVMDKDELFLMAKEYGMPVPETISIDDENFDERLEKEIGYPCLLKPTDSPKFVAHFRRKLFKCNNREELDRNLEKVRESGLEVIVQRMIPGFDDHMYTYDAYLNQNSEVTHWTTCQKHRQYPINFGASAFTEQRFVPELHEMSSKFFKDINYKGFGEIEFKKDENTGKYYMIEINARTTNFNPLLEKVGLNFPYIGYRELTGNPLPPKVVDEDTKIFFRYFQEDVLAIRAYVKTNQMTYSHAFKSLFVKKAPAIWSWDDVRPGLSYFGGVVKTILRKIFRR